MNKRTYSWTYLSNNRRWIILVFCLHKHPPDTSYLIKNRCYHRRNTHFSPRSIYFILNEEFRDISTLDGRLGPARLTPAVDEVKSEDGRLILCTEEEEPTVGAPAGTLAPTRELCPLLACPGSCLPNSRGRQIKKYRWGPIKVCPRI